MRASRHRALRKSIQRPIQPSATTDPERRRRQPGIKQQLKRLELEQSMDPEKHHEGVAGEATEHRGEESRKCRDRRTGRRHRPLGPDDVFFGIDRALELRKEIEVELIGWRPARSHRVRANRIVSTSRASSSSKSRTNHALDPVVELRDPSVSAELDSRAASGSRRPTQSTSENRCSVPRTSRCLRGTGYRM